ncbi:hypothetical protein V496_10181 [Pseudogymnoascus sp. VKM F-4515 (FW-2607)]|nr:hypothetical protein V496_10181 [Pseudogymnoascus sp. VKM F-4515 (FW-2607)]KFY95442.1 hypothetical protein V498_03360 [Pseudogymnoascus sp. VKM F-4517 (FW-2822)]
MSGNISISAIAFAAVFLFGLYKFIIYPALISPLSKIPNAHWSVPFSPFWILSVRYRWTENRDVRAAHQRLGPVVRLGPNEISIGTIDGGVKTVFGGGYEKGDWYAVFDNYGVQCTFSTLKGRPHSASKRIVSHTYSKLALQTSPAIAAQAQNILFTRLLPTLKASAHPSQKPHGLDVLQLWYSLSMDTITAYQFGLPNSSDFVRDTAYRSHWLELYQSRKPYVYYPQELPRLTSFLSNLGFRLVPRWVDNANDEIEDWGLAMCNAATASSNKTSSYSDNPGDEPVVVRAMLKGIHKESNKDQSVLSCRISDNSELMVATEMLDNLAAGHETSGITLTYATYHLSQNLELQKALRAELLTLYPPLKYSEKYIQEGSTLPGLPNLKTLDSLPLLHAVLSETLRLNAAIPGSTPRVTPYPSCNLVGYEIPGGVRVCSSAWTLHRNADVYKQPEVWDHTRWLDGDGRSLEETKERDKWFWPFSSGGRMCIGNNFAMLQMKLALAATYTNFTSHVVCDDGIEQEDGYTASPKGNKLILRFEDAE